MDRYPTSSFSTSSVLLSTVGHTTLRGRPPLLHPNGLLAPTHRVCCLVPFRRRIHLSVPASNVSPPAILIVLPARRPVGPHTSRFLIRFNSRPFGEMFFIHLVLPCSFGTPSYKSCLHFPHQSLGSRNDIGGTKGDQNLSSTQEGSLIEYRQPPQAAASRLLENLFLDILKEVSKRTMQKHDHGD